MQLPAILAHGALGWWDETIYISIAVIFVIFMIVSWLRSRNADLEDEAGEQDELTPTNQEEHFKLD